MTEQREKYSVFVAGAGGIGQAVGLLLREWASFEVDLYLADTNLLAAQEACDFIKKFSTKETTVEAVLMPATGTNESLDSVLDKCEVVLDCAPGSKAPEIARLALDHSCHYANLTEYVVETEQIIEMVRSSKTEKGFILQTGLAPGFINILAHSLFKEFCEKWKVSEVDYVSMKVGALSTSAFPPHYYGFTWSEAGVATEYLEPAIVVRDYEKQEVPSLSERAVIVLNGFTYEEDLTSGGAADLPDALAGKAKNLDYKTLRHVGHYQWIANLLDGLPEEDRRPEVLQALMEEVVPRVEDDFVLIYASVQGKDSGGKLRTKDKTFYVKPLVIGEGMNPKTLRAIQTTTAASLAQCAAILLKGEHQGVKLQSQIDPEEFLKGQFISRVYTES